MSSRLSHAWVLVLPAAFLGVCCLGLRYTRAEDRGPALETRPQSSSAAHTGDADRSQANIRVDADLVLIPVLVTDRDDRLVTGLGKEHFKLFEDKAEQVITEFASEDAPVSIALVFDCSGSMGSKLERSRAAVREFLRIANPEDEFMLVGFNQDAKLLAGFTTDTGEIQDRMLFLRSQGTTALLDAIYLALHEMRHAKHQRKAILIISDGGDNASRYSLRDVKNYIREADVQIYSIGILNPLGMGMNTPEELEGPALLDRISGQTGGRLYEVDDINQLPDIAAKIGRALRNEYLLGYMPAEARHDGKYHKIQVKIDLPKGVPPLRASFRRGYYAR